MPKLQIFRDSGSGNFSVGSTSQLMCIVATAAVVASWVVGIATSGMFAQLKFLNVGVWILYAWFSSFVIYGVARIVQIRRALAAYKRAE